MREVLLVLMFAVAANAAGGLTPGLRVKFDLGTEPGVTHFFKVPRTSAEAKADGWSRTCRPLGPLRELLMYCPPDKIVCALMDDTGYIAGLQVAIPKNNFNNNVYDWEKRGFTSWTTKVHGEVTEFWTLQQFYVSKETLQKSRKKRISRRDETRTLQEGAIWFAGPGNELLKVSTNEEDFKESMFTKQACIPWMGQHYYYNMSTTTECTGDQLYPWFVMSHQGEMTTTGFLTFGELDLKDGERDWFEHPDEATVRAIVPSGPECLYGMPTVTMHIYFVDDPSGILC